MRAYILGGLILAGVLMTSGRPAAHHSYAAEFDAGWGKGRMAGSDFVALVYNTLETPR